MSQVFSQNAGLKSNDDFGTIQQVGTFAIIPAIAAGKDIVDRLTPALTKKPSEEVRHGIGGMSVRGGVL